MQYYYLPQAIRMLLDECQSRLAAAKAIATRGKEPALAVLQAARDNPDTDPLALLEAFSLVSLIGMFSRDHHVPGPTDAELERMGPTRYGIDSALISEQFEKSAPVIRVRNIFVHSIREVATALVSYLEVILGQLGLQHWNPVLASRKDHQWHAEYVQIAQRLRVARYPQQFDHFDPRHLEEIIHEARQMSSIGAREPADLLAQSVLKAGSPEARPQLALAYSLRSSIASHRDRSPGGPMFRFLREALGAAWDERDLEGLLRLKTDDGEPYWDASALRRARPAERARYCQRARSGYFTPDLMASRELRDRADSAWQNWIWEELAAGQLAPSPLLTPRSAEIQDTWNLAWQLVLAAADTHLEAFGFAEQAAAICDRHPEFHPAVRAETEVWKELAACSTWDTFAPRIKPEFIVPATHYELEFGRSKGAGAPDHTILASAGELFRRAMGMARYIFGEDTMILESFWTNIARCCDYAELYRAADAHFQQILAISGEPDLQERADLYFYYGSHLIHLNERHAALKDEGQEADASLVLPMETLRKEHPVVWTKRALAVAPLDHSIAPIAIEWLRQMGVPQTELTRILGAAGRAREGDAEAQEVLRELRLDGLARWRRSMWEVHFDRIFDVDPISPWQKLEIQQAELDWRLFVARHDPSATALHSRRATLPVELRRALTDARKQLAAAHQVTKDASRLAIPTEWAPPARNALRTMEGEAYALFLSGAMHDWSKVGMVAGRIDKSHHFAGLRDLHVHQFLTRNAFGNGVRYAHESVALASVALGGLLSSMNDQLRQINRDRVFGVAGESIEPDDLRPFPEQLFDGHFRLLRLRCLIGAFLHVLGPNDLPPSTTTSTGQLDGGEIEDRFYSGFADFAYSGAELGHRAEAIALCVALLRFPEPRQRLALAEVLYTLATLCEGRGDNEGAIRCFQQAAFRIQRLTGAGIKYDHRLDLSLAALARLGGDQNVDGDAYVGYKAWLDKAEANSAHGSTFTSVHPTIAILEPAHRLWQAVLPDSSSHSFPDGPDTERIVALLRERLDHAERAIPPIELALNLAARAGVADDCLAAELHLLHGEALQMLGFLNASKVAGIPALPTLKDLSSRLVRDFEHPESLPESPLTQKLKSSATTLDRLLSDAFDQIVQAIHPFSDWHILSIALEAISHLEAARALVTGDWNAQQFHEERRYALTKVFGSASGGVAEAEAALALAVLFEQQNRNFAARTWLRRAFESDAWNPYVSNEAFEVASALGEKSFVGAAIAQMERFVAEANEAMQDVVAEEEQNDRADEADGEAEVPSDEPDESARAAHDRISTQLAKMRESYARQFEAQSMETGLLDVADDVIEALEAEQPLLGLVVRCARLWRDDPVAAQRQFRELAPPLVRVLADRNQRRGSLAPDGSPQDVARRLYVEAMTLTPFLAMYELHDDALATLESARPAALELSTWMKAPTENIASQFMAMRLHLSCASGLKPGDDSIWSAALSELQSQAETALASGDLFERRVAVNQLRSTRERFIQRAAIVGSGTPVTQALDLLLATSGTLEEVVLREREILRAAGLSEIKKLLRQEEALLQRLVEDPTSDAHEELAALGVELSHLAQQLSVEPLRPTRVTHAELADALGSATLLHFVRYAAPNFTISDRLGARSEGSSNYRYGALILRATGSPAFVELQADASQLEKAVSDWTTLLQENRGNDAELLAFALDLLLFDPLVPHIPSGLVYVVPAGPLHTVSFAMLRRSEDREPEDLRVSEYAFAYLNHARELVRLEALPAARGPAVVIGANDYGTSLDELTEIAAIEESGQTFAVTRRRAHQPDFPFLENAESEAADVAELLLVDSKLGPSATASVVRELQVAPTLFHAALHGYFNQLANVEEDLDSPLSFFRPLLACGIAFAGANETPGAVITGLHLARLPLSGCQLLVLSACHSAFGSEVADGILGLRQACAAAGVRANICALFTVDDSRSRQLMAWLYDALQRNLSPAEALRDAQLRALRREDRALWWDYDWGAFMPSGIQTPLPIFDRSGDPS